MKARAMVMFMPDEWPGSRRGGIVCHPTKRMDERAVSMGGELCRWIHWLFLYKSVGVQQVYVCIPR